MVDVKSKRCITELCDTRPSEKYRGYCLRCFVMTFPDEKVSRNYKTKEKNVVDYLRIYYGNKYDFIEDKIIIGGCSRRRPDIRIDFGYKVIIIEIDENQHAGYDSSCENRRLMEISRDIGHRPLVIIRFNPDSYIKNGEKKEVVRVLMEMECL